MMIGRQMPINEVIAAWNNLARSELASLKQFVMEGAATRDPRLDSQNFKLSDALERYKESLPSDHQAYFEAFIYGRKVWWLNHSDERGRWNDSSLLLFILIITSRSSSHKLLGVS